jgi:hypothetical protein
VEETDVKNANGGEESDAGVEEENINKFEIKKSS